MRQNLIGVLAVLCLAAIAGSFTTTGEVTPASPASVETVIHAGPAAIEAGGFKIGGLQLGDSRDSVMAVAAPKRPKAWTFNSGLEGVFPNCPGHASVVVYNSADLVVGLRGNSLTLPDGTLVDQQTPFWVLEKLLGKGHRRHGKGMVVALDYPSRGLSFEVWGPRAELDKVELQAVELTLPWHED